LNGYEELGREFVKSYQLSKRMKDIEKSDKPIAAQFIGDMMIRQYELMLKRYDENNIKERLEDE